MHTNGFRKSIGHVRVLISQVLLALTLPACLIGCSAAETAESAGPFAHESLAITPRESHEVVGSGLRARVYQPVRLVPDHPFTEMILSFNADVPPGSGLVVEVACASGEGLFTPFLPIASWGDVAEEWPAPTEAFGARVAIDELVLETPADFLLVRHVAFEGGGPVVIRRTDAVTTRVDPDRDLSPAPGRRVEWPVPFIGNTVDDADLRSRLCSPTSLNMLINHRAVVGAETTGLADPEPPIAHADVVKRIYSELFDLYGVWPRAIQTAWTFGVPGRLARFADWHEVRMHLETVGPIAISITAKPGEVRNMPYESDNGHLIVLAGLTEEGDAIVIDPALREEDDARRIYRAEDLTNVWLRRKRGTAYVLFDPEAEIYAAESIDRSGVENAIEPTVGVLEQPLRLSQ